jgi:hypothetical protein
LEYVLNNPHFHLQKKLDCSWKVVHVGDGVIVNLDALRTAAETYGVAHALQSIRTKPTQQQQQQLNKALRVYVRQIRRLLWPKKTYKTINAGSKTKFRSQFHKAREVLANSEFHFFHIFLII